MPRLADRDPAWLAAIEWATLDLSASYRTVFDTMVPHAVQGADPLRVVKVANTARTPHTPFCKSRHIMLSTPSPIADHPCIGHGGRRNDPLWRARLRFTIAAKRLSVEQHDQLMGLLPAGDPQREVWFAWNAKKGLSAFQVWIVGSRVQSGSPA